VDGVKDLLDGLRFTVRAEDGRLGVTFCREDRCLPLAFGRQDG
jgi:hypothetical protein